MLYAVTARLWESLGLDNVRLTIGFQVHARRGIGILGSGKALTIAIYLTLSTKSVAKGVIMGAGDVGGDILTLANHTVKHTVTAAAEGGADVGLVINRAVNGVIEATRDIGGNAGEVTKAAVEGAIEAASEIGRTAVKAVTDMLVGVVEGVKGVGGAALPTPPPRAALPPEERAPSGETIEHTP